MLAPLATELPEKANSFFWVRDGKDALALGNITGAMVFQSMIPVAFGLAFTDWDLDRFAVLSMVLGLAGGIVAYWALRLRGQFNAARDRRLGRPVPDVSVVRRAVLTGGGRHRAQSAGQKSVSVFSVRPRPT